MIPRVLRIQKMIAEKAGNPAFSALQKAVDISYYEKYTSL